LRGKLCLILALGVFVWSVTLVVGAGQDAPASAGKGLAIPDIFGKEMAEIRALVSSSIPELRVEGVQRAFYLRQWSLEPNLVPLLKDPSPLVRRKAVQAIGRCGTHVSVPHLISLLEDQNWDIREHARLALCRMTGQTLGASKAEWERWWDATVLKEKQSALLAELDGDDGDECRAACRALRSMATEGCEDAILKYLTGSDAIDAEGRGFLIEALERIGTKKSLPYLLKCASEGEVQAAWAAGSMAERMPECRDKVEDALLSGFRRRNDIGIMLNLDRVKSAKCGPFLPRLVRNFNSLIDSSYRSDDVRYPASPLQRVSANLIIRSGKGPMLVGLILSELEGKLDPGSVPKDLKPFFESLRAILEPGFLREGFGSAACLLSALYHVGNDKAIVPRLIPLLRHRSYIVRIYSALLLGKLRAPEAVGPILDVINEGYPFSDSTAMASGKHTAAFRFVDGKKVRQSQTVRWRGYLAMALGRLGGTRRGRPLRNWRRTRTLRGTCATAQWWGWASSAHPSRCRCCGPWPRRT